MHGAFIKEIFPCFSFALLGDNGLLSQFEGLMNVPKQETKSSKILGSGKTQMVVPPAFVFSGP